MNLGGFLDRLENEYGLITKVRSILAKPSRHIVTVFQKNKKEVYIEYLLHLLILVGIYIIVEV